MYALSTSLILRMNLKLFRFSDLPVNIYNSINAALKPVRVCTFYADIVY